MKIYGISSTDEMQLTLILTLKMTTHSCRNVSHYQQQSYLTITRTIISH